VPVSPANPWTALDAMAVQLNDSLTEIRTRAGLLGWTEIPEYLSYFAAFLILMACGGILQLVSGWLVMLSTFLGAFGIALAPLFILAAAFQVSRQFFMNWVSYMLNVALLSGVAMFAIAVSLGLVNWVFLRVSSMPGGLLDNTTDFFLIVGFLAVVHVMLAVMVYQGPAITAQMMGASGFGQGGGLAQTVLLLSRMGGSRGSAASAALPSPVGAVSAPSAAYRAGQATGQAGRYVYQRVASRMRRP
jgi:type IV secretory pathway VirB6-like protein